MCCLVEGAFSFISVRFVYAARILNYYRDLDTVAFATVSPDRSPAFVAEIHSRRARVENVYSTRFRNSRPEHNPRSQYADDRR